jgi:hypothetical protein
VVVGVADDEVVGEGLNAETPWEFEWAQLVHIASHRVEVLQISAIEGLYAMATVIAYEDALVLVVKGDAPWEVESAICVACFPIAES